MNFKKEVQNFIDGFSKKRKKKKGKNVVSHFIEFTSLQIIIKWGSFKRDV